MEPLTLDQEGNIIDEPVRIKPARVVKVPGAKPRKMRELTEMEQLQMVVRNVEGDVGHAIDLLTDPRMIGNIALLFLSRLK